MILFVGLIDDTPKSKPKNDCNCAEKIIPSKDTRMIKGIIKKKIVDNLARRELNSNKIFKTVYTCAQRSWNREHLQNNLHNN